MIYYDVKSKDLSTGYSQFNAHAHINKDTKKFRVARSLDSIAITVTHYDHEDKKSSNISIYIDRDLIGDLIGELESLK